MSVRVLSYCHPKLLVVELTKDNRGLLHAAYILANPCAADLVALLKDWRGVSSWKLEYGKKFMIRRPRLGIWARKKNKTRKRRRKKASLSGEPISSEEIVAVLERATDV